MNAATFDTIQQVCLPAGEDLQLRARILVFLRDVASSSIPKRRNDTKVCKNIFVDINFESRLLSHFRKKADVERRLS
jgi:hypothetical protein